MENVLLNEKKEKILSYKPISKSVISSLFEFPNFYAIVFFSEASGSLVIDGKEISIKDYTILFYYPYQQLVLKGNFKGYAINFHPDFFCIDIHAKDIGCQGLLFNNFFQDTLLKCTENEFNSLFEVYRTIQTELVRKNIGQLDMVSSQLKIFLIKAVRSKLLKQKEEATVKEVLYFQIEKLIEEHYSLQSSANFYSKKINVSLATFNRLCRKYFQSSFISLLNLKRISVAKNKLFLTNSSIKDISYQVGYNDPLYFSRIFKKHTGISPKEFRNQLKNNRLI